MKQISYVFILLVILAGSIMTGCSSRNDTAHNLSSATEYYTCPMHPSVRTDRPGACPICGMTLVKVTAAQRDTATSYQRETVAVSPSRQILAGITTTKASLGWLNKEIAAVGKIDYPESSSQQITTRFAGRIERLSVSFVGQRVKQGEPVAEIYSPDAIVAQREYLLSLESSNAAESSPSERTMNNQKFINQTREKLKLWGFNDKQIQDLAATRLVKNTVTVYSPISGSVVRKNVELQRYVSQGEALFDVAELGTVWLLLDVYESDISSVTVGQRVAARIDAFPSEDFNGTISFISPMVDAGTRTVRVRATLDNKSGRLKPEMFAQAIIVISLPETVIVPTSAVIETGKRTAVWVQVAPGRFEARAITLGVRDGDMYQVLQGLHADEIIAASGGFLLDSESQLEMATVDAHRH